MAEREGLSPNPLQNLMFPAPRPERTFDLIPCVIPGLLLGGNAAHFVASIAGLECKRGLWIDLLTRLLSGRQKLVDTFRG